MHSVLYSASFLKIICSNRRIPCTNFLNNRVSFVFLRCLNLRTIKRISINEFHHSGSDLQIEITVVENPKLSKIRVSNFHFKSSQTLMKMTELKSKNKLMNLHENLHAKFTLVITATQNKNSLGFIYFKICKNINLHPKDKNLKFCKEITSYN